MEADPYRWRQMEAAHPAVATYEQPTKITTNFSLRLQESAKSRNARYELTEPGEGLIPTFYNLADLGEATPCIKKIDPFRTFRFVDRRGKAS